MATKDSGKIVKERLEAESGNDTLFALVQGRVSVARHYFKKSEACIVVVVIDDPARVDSGLRDVTVVLRCYGGGGDDDTDATVKAFAVYQAAADRIRSAKSSVQNSGSIIWVESIGGGRLEFEGETRQAVVLARFQIQIR